MNTRRSNKTDKATALVPTTRRNFLRTSAVAIAGSAAPLLMSDLLMHSFATQQSVGRIFIDIEEVVGDISRNLYGHMMEHVGRGVYDGIWVGENSTTPNDKGFRRDAITALKRLRAPVIRWPGGCFADTYHWQDGVGPRDKRPKRRNLWWETDETNAVGTDEFADSSPGPGGTLFLDQRWNRRC